MLTMSNSWQSAITASARQMTGKAEVYTGEELVYTFLPDDYLKSIAIEGISSGKMFGYTICKKATIKIIDANKTFTISKGQIVKASIGCQDEYVNYPPFYVEEVERDETSNIITITAYDIMAAASNYITSDLDIVFPLTIVGYAAAIATLLGVTSSWETEPQNIEYREDLQPNLSGTETLRELLGYIAEATTTVCFIDNSNRIFFASLDGSVVDLAITREDYFELTTGEAITLSKVTSATELGDNLSVGTDEGYNQILRDNPFIVNREDIADILTNILKSITIYPYSLKWRGNPALEIGDCITLEKADGTAITTFYLGETLTYNGGCISTSEWEGAEKEDEDSTPATIGEAIKQTYAKVDKINNTIELLASQTDENTENIANLLINTDSITASVQQMETNTQEALDAVNEDISTLTNKVEGTMTSEEVILSIQSALSNGVTTVTTDTGFTFDSKGLLVSKSDSDMSTLVDETGMTVSNTTAEVLTATNDGVNAINLTSRQYLIISGLCRFEKYGDNRIGCFWIGGE